MSRKKVSVWTEHLITEEARKYTRRGDFAKGANGAWQAAKRLGILEEVCAHMPKRKWTREALIAEAKKYTTRSDFMRGSRTAHVMASKYGLIEDICVHMPPVIEAWDEPKVIAIANSYDDLADFRRNDNNAYVATIRLGILDIATAHMARTRHHWSDEQLAEIASKFDNVAEFKLLQPNPYHIASRRKILPAITSHMASKIPRSNMLYCIVDREVYEDGKHLAKIGVTSTFRANDRVSRHISTWFSDAAVVFLIHANDARSREASLLREFPVKPDCMNKKDGHSELRLVSSEDISYLANYGRCADGIS